jgi:hypothetical protein
MTLTVNLRKTVHRKSIEYCTSSPFGVNAAGTFLVYDNSNILPARDSSYFVGGASSIYGYSCDEDAWVTLSASGIAGTFAAGACGRASPLGAPAGVTINTATAGTTTTLTTALTIVKSLAGCEIRVIAGTGVGYVGTILSNTLGANSVITVTTASSTAFSSTSQYQIFSGSLWFMNAGTAAVGFSVYDRATAAWTARSVTNIPTSWATDACLVTTVGRASNRGTGFVNGTATAGASTTLTDTAKAWLTNGWANAQVRIISGTGLGQIRTISSNTATVLTVSSAWTTTPDATSVYRIEGNEDYLYLIGNAAVTMYRYSISGNAWTVLAPTTARAAAVGAGCTAEYVDSVQASNWTDGTYGAHYSTTLFKQNGRYIYSFRGGATGTLDVYDIAANTWINAVAIGNTGETFSTGSCAAILDGYIYLQRDATSRFLRFGINENNMDPLTYNPVPQSTAVAGGKVFILTYIEGTTRLNYLYAMGNTRAELVRWVLV